MLKVASTGERLKEYMDTYKLRQADIINRILPVAEKYGVNLSSGAVSQYCSDRSQPKQIMTLVMAEALGVDPAWIMGADVPMRRKLTEGIGAEASEFYVRFLKLSERDKKVVRQLIDTLISLPESKEVGKESVDES